MEELALRKPVNVSPFIKLIRWSLLIYGMMYGNKKWHYYHNIQVRRRQEYEKIRPSVEARKQAEQIERATAEIKGIYKEFGAELPHNWTAADLFHKWGLLIAGIGYGMSKFKTYSMIQKSRRDAYESDRPAREKRENAERLRNLQENMAELEKALGVSMPVEPDTKK